MKASVDKNTLIPIDKKNLDKFKAYSTFHFYKKNDFVFQAGRNKANFYLLLSGRVKLYRVSALGKEVTQWFCFPGEAFGLSELHTSNHKTLFAQCSEESEVLAIPLSQFNRFLQQSPEISLKIIEQLSVRLKIAGDTLLNITSDDAKTRLIKLLSRLVMRFGIDYKNGILIDVQLTYKEIADMIGTCRQTVTTALGELKEKGDIKIIGHQFFIPNPTSFEMLAGYCDSKTIDKSLLKKASTYDKQLTH